MVRPELSIAPRVKGRAVVPLQVEFVRELGPGDLALLASEREVTAPASIVERLHDRHHALARCLAGGMGLYEASAVTGYSYGRVQQLSSQDPTFKALVEHYKKQEDSLMADFMERTTTLTLTAINTLQEDLENVEKPLPASMRLEIAKFGADRTGHAPIQKTFNVNANVDLGSRMSEARKRLAQVVEAKKIGPASS